MATRRTKAPTSIADHSHWFKLSVGAPVHEHVVSLGKVLLKNESNFHAKNLARERIYRGVELMRHQAAVAALEGSGRSIARLNAIRAIGDTFASRLAKDRPMPGFVTDDSDWELKRKAKRYRQFIVGQMLETEFDDLDRRALQDGVKLGNGFTRIDDNDDAVFAERLPVNDLLFDRRECKYGKPRNAMRVQRVARDYLAELFPKFRDDIDRCPSSERRKDDVDTDGDGPKIGELDDYVDVFEPWHLPTIQESKDGRHALCIETATLVTELWWEPRFPWAMFQLGDPDWGMYSEGFVDQLAPLQHRVNCIVRDIQLNLTATGRGFFMVNEANDIPTEMLTGFMPFKLKFRGSQAPTWNAPAPFNPAQLSALDKFIGYMFQFSGVSQANAESRSALGPGASGVALDTQYDIDSDRFRIPQANRARYRLTAAQCYLDAAARVSRHRNEGKGAKRSWVAVSWKGRDAIQKLDYDKVTLKEGSYRLRMEPIGFLPDTRAGKLSVVEQLAKAGVIPQWMVPMLFDEPDLQEANRILLAPIKNCLRKMDDLIEVDEPMPMPEEYNDLDVELEIAKGYYNWVQAEKAPDDVQDRFRQYIDMVVHLKKPAASAAAPAMAPAQQPLPGGIPMMPQGPVPAPTPIGAPPASPMPMMAA